MLGDSMPNNKYLIYRTFVKERGAGKEYDYWIFDRTTKTSVNISELLRQNKDFIEKYKDTPSNSGLFLTFYSRWVEDNPAFSIANGWEIVGEYWIYDFEKASFYYYPRKD